MVEMDQSKDVGAAAAEEPSSTTRTPELRMSTSVKSSSSVSNGSSSCTRGSSATTATADICISRSLSQDYGWTDWEDEDEGAATTAATAEQDNKHANNNNTYSSGNRSLPIVNKDDSGSDASAVAAVASSTPDQTTTTTQPRSSSVPLLESPVEAKEEAIRIRSSSSHQEQQQQQPADTGDAATQRQSLLLSSSNSNVSFGSSMMLLEPSSLPAQLHPAVSLGMRRMSSCYFSLGSSSPDLLVSADDPSHSGGCGGEGASIGMSHPASVADLLSLLEDESQQQLEESSERQESFRTASPWTNSMENNKKDDENGTDENTNNQTSDKKKNVNSTINNNSSYWNTAAAAAVAYTSSSSDLLYHDILMNVFTYLDAKSLAAFSETARRPNFECFYFLQLQLQRALVVVPPPASSSDATTTVDTTTTTRSEQHHHHDPLLSAIAGVGALNRLAALDPARAAAIVQDFLDSNSTLRVMPLSHSLAYFRQVLRRHYPAVLLLKNRTTTTTSSSSSLGGDGGANSNNSSSSMAARAALLITVVGAASSLMSGSASGAEADVMAYMNDCFQSSPFGTELPNMLFSVGFVGSLVGAARTMSSELQQQQQQQNTQGNNNDNNGETTTTSAAALRNSQLTMRQRAEIALHKAYCAAYGYSTGSNSTSHNDKDDGTSATSATTTTSPRSWPSLSSSPRSNASGDAAAALVLDDLSPQTPNPYEHLAPVHESAPQQEDENSSNQQKQQQQLQQPKRAAPPERKLPSGCIGAYSRAVASATRAVTDILKERRQKAYEALPPEEQRQVSQTFIDACTSDDNLDVVKDLIQGQEVIHVDGFYIGADGTESCALHCSSFHGSTAILEYLCRGLDNNHDESTCRHEPNDGGLAILDQADDNGWTALHFAAGANSVEAVRILAEHGANLSIEAVNGYTPLQWAVRLHNQAAADELRRQAALRAAGSKNNSTPHWMTLRNQPLSKICHSFLDALVPSH